MRKAWRSPRPKMSDFVFPYLAFSFLHISQLENKVNIISRLRQFWDMQHLLWMKVYAHTQHSNGFLCVVLNLDATWGKRGNFLFSLAGKKLEILSLSRTFFWWILHAPQYHILTKTKNSNSHLHFLSLQKLDFLSEQQFATTTIERTIKVLKVFVKSFHFFFSFFSSQWTTIMIESERRSPNQFDAWYRKSTI